MGSGGEVNTQADEIDRRGEAGDQASEETLETDRSQARVKGGDHLVRKKEKLRTALPINQ